jgi:hypothetical protein
LTQYLYKNKKLSLPGIGVFVLDPGAVIPSEHSKESHIPASGIEFTPSTHYQVDDELIEYIKTHTGKMKSLAQADLESFLTLGTELLNIGKPFYLEGIGTLTKGREGKFEFTPGEYSVVKSEEGAPQKKDRPGRIPVQESESTDASSISGGSRKPLIFLIIVAGLALAGWGGYLVYKKNGSGTNQETGSTPDTTAVRTDSTKRLATMDSTSAVQRLMAEQVKPDSATYKYIILQTYNKNHALRRYNQLLSMDQKVKMETTDSTFFKVYFRFPARNKDTVHIKDSLYRFYAHRVTIER